MTDLVAGSAAGPEALHQRDKEIEGRAFQEGTQQAEGDNGR